MMPYPFESFRSLHRTYEDTYEEWCHTFMETITDHSPAFEYHPTIGNWFERVFKEGVFEYMS
jgi:hypothetical protein